MNVAFCPKQTPVASAVWSLNTLSSCHCLHMYTLHTHNTHMYTLHTHVHPAQHVYILHTHHTHVHPAHTCTPCTTCVHPAHTPHTCTPCTHMYTLHNMCTPCTHITHMYTLHTHNTQCTPQCTELCCWFGIKPVNKLFSSSKRFPTKVFRNPAQTMAITKNRLAEQQQQSVKQQQVGWSLTSFSAQIQLYQRRVKQQHAVCVWIGIALAYKCTYHYRQRNAPVFKLLRCRFWGFSHRRGDTLHRWGWNLAWRVPSSMPNFTPIGETVRVQDPQNWNFYWDLIKMWNINAPQGRTRWSSMLR